MKHDTHYWIDRLQADSGRLSEDKKYQLIKSLLVHEVPLEADEVDFFFNTNPNAENLDNATLFSGIKRKVALAYTRQRAFDNPERREGFLNEFRAILKGFYTKDELDEIIPYMVDGGEGLAVKWLVGLEHPAVRKIRNAYLPEITSLIRVDITPQGRILGAEDETHILFNGSEDAVSQIERIVGVKKSE